MRSQREPIRSRKTMVVFVLWCITAFHSRAESPPLAPPARPLRLADCLAISYERQPVLTVARIRLATAQSERAALESLDGPLARHKADRPMRLQQAQLSVRAAQAELAAREVENRYVVTRLYLSVLYSRAQRSILDDLVDDLRELRERVHNSVEKKERPEWTEATVDLITLYLRRAEARQAEALRGIDLSLAALREALNVPPNVCLNIADEPIPQPAATVCREDVIAAAVSRRGEVVEANLAAEATILETDAQSVSHRRRVSTFAAAIDLHAQQVPQASYGEEFRPGGVPLAMPHVLIGPRNGRVETAQDLSAQAQVLAEKTRNLIVLEAEEAYYLWQEWSRKVVALKEAEKIGERLGSSMRQEFRGTIKRVIDTLLPESLLAAQARTDYQEAVFRQAIALAALERVTGGLFCAGLANAPAPPQP